MSQPYVDASRSEGPAPGQNPGVWIEEQCRCLGVPLAQVARDSDIDRSTITRWRLGTHSPYLGTFERVRSTIRSYWTRIERETR